jgi:hypothetical protein
VAVRYGTVDELDGDGDFPIHMSGAGKVGTAVLLGTPNLGAVSSLQSMLLGHRVGLRRIEPEVLATMPSIYELLPHPLTDWSVDPSAIDLDLDLYDVATWKRMQWSVFDPTVIGRLRARFKRPREANAYISAQQAYFVQDLERARRFIWSVTFEEPSSPVKFVVFGGNCVLTPARIVTEPQAGRSQARLFPEDLRDKVPGVDYGRLMLESRGAPLLHGEDLRALAVITAEVDPCSRSSGAAAVSLAIVPASGRSLRYSICPSIPG